MAAPRLIAYSPEVAALAWPRCDRCRIAGLRAGVRRQCARSTACSPTRRTTAATSSATGPASSATAAPSPWARSSTPAGERWELQLKGAGPTPYSRTRRRSRRAALVGARVPVQRGDASPGRADHPRAEPGGHRRAGRARHVLRRSSARPSRARSSAVWRLRSSASATSSCRPRAATSALLDAACRLHDPSAISRSCARGERAKRSTRTGSRRCASAPRAWSRTGCASASCTG